MLRDNQDSRAEELQLVCQCWRDDRRRNKPWSLRTLPAGEAPGSWTCRCLRCSSAARRLWLWLWWLKPASRRQTSPTRRTSRCPALWSCGAAPDPANRPKQASASATSHASRRTLRATQSICAASTLICRQGSSSPPPTLLFHLTRLYTRIAHPATSFRRHRISHRFHHVCQAR